MILFMDGDTVTDTFECDSMDAAIAAIEGAVMYERNTHALIVEKMAYYTTITKFEKVVPISMRKWLCLVLNGE
jgi:hypothetical protein